MILIEQSKSLGYEESGDGRGTTHGHPVHVDGDGFGAGFGYSRLGGEGYGDGTHYGNFFLEGFGDGKGFGFRSERHTKFDLTNDMAILAILALNQTLNLKLA